MKVARTGLTKPLKEGDYDGLVEVMGHLMKVKERQAATDSMFEPLKQTIELLKTYGEEIPEETHAKLQVDAGASPWPGRGGQPGWLRQGSEGEGLEAARHFTAGLGKVNSQHHSSWWATGLVGRDGEDSPGAAAPHRWSSSLLPDPAASPPWLPFSAPALCPVTQAHSPCR